MHTLHWPGWPEAELLSSSKARLSQSSTNTDRAACQCVGVLAAALRGAWRPYGASLIEPMILTGLSPTLVQALQACTHPIARVLLLKLTPRQQPSIL